MATLLEHIAWEPCLLERRPDRDLEAYARRRQGMSNPTVAYFAPTPWVARAAIDLHPEYGMLMHLEQHVADLISLVVSQENSCRFCYAATRAMLWAQGMSRERIERMEQDLAQAALAPRELAAIAFARSQSRAGAPAAEASRAALREAGYSSELMREIAFAAASTDFLNRTMAIPAIPPYAFEGMPNQLHTRLLRPLIGKLIKKHQRRAQMAPPEPIPDIPYARLLRAMSGTSIAAALTRTLNEMWASRELTRRCKLLIQAVIARGLGCESTAVEVQTALFADGLDDATLSRILTHLDDPILDAVERLVVPFARETIWYEPAHIQRRARTLRQQLSATQFLEAVGVTALANGLCRMSAFATPSL